MKIALISAHLLANSGYGKVAREICVRLADLGYEVYAIGGFGWQSMYGMHVEIQTPNGKTVKCLQTWQDPAGSTVFHHYHRMFKFDLVISLWDYQLTQYLNNVDVPWIAQGPIDAPLTRKWANMVRNAIRIVAYSKYAFNELLKYYPPSKLRYIPHGVNTEVYRPYTEFRREVREKLEVPEDAFLLINVSDNVPRKNLGFLLYCFKKFIEKHPNEKIYLYLHTNWSIGFPRGLDIPGLINELDLGERVKLPALDPMINPMDDLQLALIYSACDVMIHTSISEGFGLPLLEAMACGVPVIAVKSSAMVELVEPATGWLIDVVEDTIFYPTWIDTLQYHHMPSIKSCLERLEQAYESWKTGELEKLRRKCIEFAKQFDWSNIIPMWVDLIEEVRDEIEMFRGCFEW